MTHSKSQYERARLPRNVSAVRFATVILPNPFAGGRGRAFNGDRLVSMNETSDCSDEVRKQWVKRATDSIWGPQSNGSLQAMGLGLRP